MVIPRFVKNVLRQILAGASSLTGSAPRNLTGKVICLMYHRVLRQADLDRYHVQPGMYVRDDIFDQHIIYLKKHFRILSCAELLALWQGRSWDPEQRYCVITFDDGWLDNYLHAYPVLRKYDAPATIFLPTGLIGTDHWFWPDRVAHVLGHCLRSPDGSCLRRLYDRWPKLKNDRIPDRSDEIDRVIEQFKTSSPEEVEQFLDDAASLSGCTLPRERLLLNWDEVREMSGHGISFGSHSVSHGILPLMSPGQAQEEITGSLRALRDRAVNHVPVFCYPNGSSSPELAGQVRAAGYAAAVTTRFGYEGSAPDDLFRIKRIGIHNDISMTTSLFRWHIEGGNKLFGR